MIQRINLIEKKPFTLTYGRMALAFGIVFGFLLLLLGFQEARQWYIGSKVSRLEKNIAQIRLERDQLFKAAPTKLEEGSQAELRQIFRDTPDWEKVMDDLTHRLPGKVWLSNLTLRLLRPPPAGSAEKTPKKEESLAAPTGKGLLMSGRAQDPASVAVFLTRLQESPFFRNVTLTGTKRDKNVYTFSMEGEINPGTR